jgi:parvulin-like peptidyl-prolyl isomerase
MMSFCLFAHPSHGVIVDRVLATVGDEIITYADYQQFVKNIGETETKDLIDEKLLKRLIEERIILQEAGRKGIEVSDTEVDGRIEEFIEENGLSQEELEGLMKEDGMSLKNFRKHMKDEIISSKLVHEDVDMKIITTDKEVEDFYQANINDFQRNPEKVELKAIFLELKEDASVTELTDIKLRALKIAGRLKEGDNFDRLVDEYSDEPLKSLEGRLGTFARGALIPLLDKKAFSLKAGEISDPVWVSEGVYILQLMNKTGESYKSFEEMKGEIQNNLYRQKREKLFNEWIKALWEKSSVVINQS